MSPELIGTMLVIAISAVPFWKMLDRTGLPKLWLITFFLPILGTFILWLVLARSQWRTAGEPR